MHHFNMIDPASYRRSWFASLSWPAPFDVFAACVIVATLAGVVWVFLGLWTGTLPNAGTVMLFPSVGFGLLAFFLFKHLRTERPQEPVASGQPKGQEETGLPSAASDVVSVSSRLLSADELQFIAQKLAEAKVFKKYNLRDKARDQLEAILAQFPGNADALLGLAVLCLEKGDKVEYARLTRLLAAGVWRGTPISPTAPNKRPSIES